MFAEFLRHDCWGEKWLRAFWRRIRFCGRGEASRKGSQAGNNFFGQIILTSVFFNLLNHGCKCHCAYACYIHRFLSTQWWRINVLDNLCHLCTSDDQFDHSGQCQRIYHTSWDRPYLRSLDQGCFLLESSTRQTEGWVREHIGGTLLETSRGQGEYASI